MKEVRTIFFFIKQLIEKYFNMTPGCAQENLNDEIQLVCTYLEEQYSENITLDQLSMLNGFSKYYVLHSFTKQRGISPCNYLQTIRIGKAQKLLAQGVPPIEAAMQTGF